MSSGDDLVPVADLTSSLNSGAMFLFQHLKPFTTESELIIIIILHNRAPN